MKRKIAFLLLIISVFVFAGCQSNAGEVAAVMADKEALATENNQLKAEIVTLEETIATLEARLNALEEGQLSESASVNINDLKAGGTLNGLTIAAIEFNGSTFNIELQDQFTVDGYFSMDAMYGTVTFTLADPSSVFPTQIDFNDKGMLNLFPFFEIKNEDHLKAELGQALYSELLNNNSFEYKINATVEFDHYAMGAKWGSEGAANATLVHIIEKDK